VWQCVHGVCGERVGGRPIKTPHRQPEDTHFKMAAIGVVLEEVVVAVAEGPY
jgi:hypothetical protein